MQAWCKIVCEAGVHVFGKRHTRQRVRARARERERVRETHRPEPEDSRRLAMSLAMRLLKLRLFDAYFHHQLMRQVVFRDIFDVDVHHLKGRQTL